MIIWAVIQAVFIFFFHGNYPALLLGLQRLISTRDLFPTRITSFAFEPSWLAQQLNLLYLPFWFAATIKGWSTFSFRLWKLSLENILLGCGVVVLFLSSRVGTLALLLIIAFLLVYLNVFLARRIQTWTIAALCQISPFGSENRSRSPAPFDPLGFPRGLHFGVPGFGIWLIPCGLALGSFLPNYFSGSIENINQQYIFIV